MDDLGALGSERALTVAGTDAGSNSAVVFEIVDRPLAFSDEVIWLLGALPAGAEFDLDEARAEADDVFVATMTKLLDLPAPEAPRTAAVLVGNAEQRLALGREVVVGRHGDLPVDHRLVSRRHLMLRYDAEGLWCRDLGSANGTWLRRGDARSPVDHDGCALTAGDRIVTVQDHELLAVIEVG